VGSIGDVSSDEPFLGHDLELFQHGGVGDRTAFANDRLVNVPYRAWLTIPQDPQDF
jgi:hypothetical protein